MDIITVNEIYQIRKKKMIKVRLASLYLPYALHINARIKLYLEYQCVREIILINGTNLSE